MNVGRRGCGLSSLRPRNFHRQIGVDDRRAAVGDGGVVKGRILESEGGRRLRPHLPCVRGEDQILQGRRDRGIGADERVGPAGVGEGDALDLRILESPASFHEGDLQRIRRVVIRVHQISPGEGFDGRFRRGLYLLIGDGNADRRGESRGGVGDGDRRAVDRRPIGGALVGERERGGHRRAGLAFVRREGQQMQCVRDRGSGAGERANPIGESEGDARDQRIREAPAAVRKGDRHGLADADIGVRQGHIRKRFCGRLCSGRISADGVRIGKRGGDRRISHANQTVAEQ